MVTAPLRGQKEAQRRSAPKGGGETAEPEAEETRGDSRTQESLVSDGQRVSKKKPLQKRPQWPPTRAAQEVTKAETEEKGIRGRS